MTRLILLLALALAIIAGILWANWYIADRLWGVCDASEFGELFGASASLFAGVAMWAALWMLHVQHKQLREQQGQQRSMFESQTRMIEQQKEMADALVDAIYKLRDQTPEERRQRLIHNLQVELELLEKQAQTTPSWAIGRGVEPPSVPLRRLIEEKRAKLKLLLDMPTT